MSQGPANCVGGMESLALAGINSQVTNEVMRIAELAQLCEVMRIAEQGGCWARWCRRQSSHVFFVIAGA